MPAPASAATEPIATIHRVRSVKISAAHDEHRAVVRDDRAGPDDVEHAARPCTAARRGGPAASASPATRVAVADRAAGEQRDADAGDEHERRREPRRQRARPRVEELGRPAVADARWARLVGRIRGSRGSSSRRRRSGRRRARRRGRAADVPRRGRSPAGSTSGRRVRAIRTRRRRSSSAAAARRLDRRLAGSGPPAGTKHIDVCMCGGSSRSSRGRSKWNGLRPSSSGGDAVGGAGADHHEVAVGRRSRRGGSRRARRRAPRRTSSTSALRWSADLSPCHSAVPSRMRYVVGRRRASAYARGVEVADPHRQRRVDDGEPARRSRRRDRRRCRRAAGGC